MKHNNLMAKYGITGEELKKAIDQVNLGKVACSGAVLCALCDLLANGDIEGSADSAPVIIFADKEHEQFYYEQLEKSRNKDCWHKALFYTLGLTEDCRRHFREIFDFEKDQINRKSLRSGWVTGTDARTMRLAFNLFTDYIPEGEEDLYTLASLLSNNPSYIRF